MCACVCVTLAWPGAKVGCPERQCVCSHAFSSRLAGFITATNHWPDKSSYFILPPSSSSSPPSSPFPLLSVGVLHASPCAPPHSLSLIALFLLSSVFFSLSLLPTHPFSSAPPLFLSFYRSVSTLPLCGVMNLWTGANNCTSAQVLVFLCVWELWQARAPSSQHPIRLFVPLFSLFFPSIHTHTQWVGKITQGLQGHPIWGFPQRYHVEISI